MVMIIFPLLTILAAATPHCTNAFLSSSFIVPPSSIQNNNNNGLATTLTRLQLSSSSSSTTSLPPGIENQPTELPDSLSDAASIAANVSFYYVCMYVEIMKYSWTIYVEL